MVTKSLVDYAQGWYHPGEVAARDGHVHTYLFRTLRCASCVKTPTVYQFVNGPNYQVLPPRPPGPLIFVERADKWLREMNARLRHGHHMLYVNGMFTEYPMPIDEDRMCPTETIPPGWEYLDAR